MASEIMFSSQRETFSPGWKDNTEIFYLQIYHFSDTCWRSYFHFCIVLTKLIPLTCNIFLTLKGLGSPFPLASLFQTAPLVTDEKL